MRDTKLKVLVVDDESEARQSLAFALKANGYEVLELETGREVFSKVKNEWPALVILDIILPDISGIEVFDQLRADPITKSVPILLLTAKPDVVREKLAGLPEKSYRFLPKPSRIDELLKAVREMLMGSQS